MPLASLTRRLLGPRMDGLTGRAPSSGITTAQLAEAAPASVRVSIGKESLIPISLDCLARAEHGPGGTGNGEHGRQLNWMSDRREQLRPEQAVEQRHHATAQRDQNEYQKVV